MSRGIRCRYCGCVPVNFRKSHKIGLEPWVDISDRVVDSRMQDCKITGRMNGCGLSTLGPNDREKRSIPFNDRIDLLRRSLALSRSTGECTERRAN